jgi:hypothetical protein
MNKIIEIEANLKGKHKIIIDGKDISDMVTQACLMLYPGEIPRLELCLSSDIIVKGKPIIKTII